MIIRRILVERKEKNELLIFVGPSILRNLPWKFSQRLNENEHMARSRLRKG